MVVKPVDCASSKAVSVIYAYNELEDAVKEALDASNKKKIIIERFIEGKEYLADGFGVNNKYYTLDVGEKEFFNVQGRCMSSMCMFTSVSALRDDIKKKVRDANNKLFRNMCLPFGITHAEWMYSYKDEKVYLVECAARGGGVYLSDYLTPWATGFSPQDALLDYLMEDGEVVVEEEKLEGNVSGWLQFLLPDGIIKEIYNKEKIQLIENVQRVLLDDVSVGMKTEMAKDDNGKYGPILMKANSEKALLNTIDNIRGTLNIQVDTSEGMKGIIW